MIKIKENKQRKKLRISLCVMYLFQVLLCTFPFYQTVDSDGYLQTYSVLDMISYIGGTGSDTQGQMLQSALWFFLIPIALPVIGFFFCLFDKERNLKNIVSEICCLGGVVSIIMLQGSVVISLGAIFSLILYIIMCFVTVVSMFARITKDDEKGEKK